MDTQVRTIIDKLKSRKFWGEVVGVAVGLYIIFGMGNVEAGVGLIAAAITGYNIAEAYVDGKNAASNITQVTASSTSKELVQKLLDASETPTVEVSNDSQ
jgi:hypothetical protein